MHDTVWRHIEKSGPCKHGLIFINKHVKPINSSHFVHMAANPVLARLGIREKIKAPGIRDGNYAFRRGNITELSRAGVTEKTIQASVDHTPGSEVTKIRYIDAVGEGDVAAGDLMDALLWPKQKEKVVQ